ncbi:MAG TPA: hypothetical protein VN846_06195, partial [Candidatus Cybelea sp.]|nr:hypothetical protein [Candidatus Cybelea sp.]
HFWGPALAAILCPKIAPVALQLCPIYQSPVPLLLFFSHYQNFRNGWRAVDALAFGHRRA